MGIIQSLDSGTLKDIATRYGTPLYVYDGDLITQQYKGLYDLIKWPKLEIFYAMKANYNVGILKLLKNLNGKLDLVSPAEAMLALKVGFSPKALLYTANNITEREMEEVQKLGVLFNIGSLSRLEKFGEKFPGSEVCLRFNPDVIAGSHKKIQTGGAITKFGILMQDVEKVKIITQKYNLAVIGIHEHTGSGIAEKEKVYESMRNLLGVATKENFPHLHFIDFGGGFKVPYHPDEQRIDYQAFGSKLTEIFTEYCRKYGKDLVMRFEPGKYIVAEAGYMLVRVNTVKDNRGRIIAGTDSGFPQLIRPMFYEAYHHVLNLSNPGGETGKYDVSGNICETGDVFAEQRELPKIREGDYLAFQNAGAYCYAMGGVYNLRSMPSEVLVLNGEPEMIRQRLTDQELADQIWNASS